MSIGASFYMYVYTDWMKPWHLFFRLRTDKLQEHHFKSLLSYSADVSWSENIWKALLSQKMHNLCKNNSNNGRSIPTYPQNWWLHFVEWGSFNNSRLTKKKQKQKHHTISKMWNQLRRTEFDELVCKNLLKLIDKAKLHSYHIEHSRLFCICWRASRTSFTFTDMSVYRLKWLKRRQKGKNITTQPKTMKVPFSWSSRRASNFDPSLPRPNLPNLIETLCVIIQEELPFSWLARWDTRLLVLTHELFHSFLG